MGAIRVNGEIEGNEKYKKMMDDYLKSPLFADRCAELKKLIREAEERKKKETEIREKSSTMKLFE